MITSFRAFFKKAAGWTGMNRVIPLLIMIVIGLVSWSLVDTYRENLIDQQKLAVKQDTDEIASFLISRINSRQAMLTGIAAMIKSHADDGLLEDDFKTFAQGLKANDPAIRVIQFFPINGAVMLFPLAGNEAVVNRTLEQLLTDQRPEVREDVKRAIDSRQITLSNPYKLTQGGQGVVARLAVYRQDDLLGIVTVVLNQDSLLDIPGLSPPTPDVRYAIRDTRGRTFFGDDQVFYLDPVVSTIVLPEGSWLLGSVPEGGWEADLFPRMLLPWAIGALVTLLAGYVISLNTNNQLRLRKMVEERTAALAESEARYVQTFKVVNDGIWDWHITAAKGIASENFYSILGLDSSDFHSPDDWLPCFHEDDRFAVKEQIQQGIADGKGFNIEARLLARNSRIPHVLIRGRIVEWDAAGQPARLLGTISDITEQLRAEENLRESEAKFRAIYNNNHAVMMLVDPDTGEVIDANPAACAFYGYDHATICTLRIDAFNTLPFDEVKKMMQIAVKESRSPFIFEHRLADGQIRDVEVFSGPIEQKGKTILFSIVHDVTSRRQAEKILIENENRLRFALEGANDGLWDINLQTGEFYMSPRGCQVLGYEQGAIPSDIKTWAEMMHPDDLPETYKRLDAHLKGLSEMVEMEQRLKMKNGEWKWILSRGKLVGRDAQGQPLRMTGTHTDISQRKLTEEKINAAQQELKRLLSEADATRQVLLSMLEDQKSSEEKLGQLNVELERRVHERTIQLETANNELEAFSYSVSHDLRAPLRGIDGWSLALVEDYGEQLDDKAQLYLHRVRGESQRMGDLIDDLLRLSRVTRMELKRSKVNLSNQAETIIERIKEEFKENPPEFILQPDIQAYGDAQLLEIVMTNLLSNACKFSARQTPPRIEFGEIVEDGTRTYYVRDNGVGFDSNNARKLFGAFQRMHKQTEYPGTGIGLATVKRVISRHGGQVWAEAQKDRGATFYFTLPEVK